MTVANQNNPQFAEQYYSALDTLFTKAREIDEFEYVLTLIRVRGGIEDAGWDPLLETDAFFSEFWALLQAPLNNYTKIRLSLVLYCHLLEVESIYWLIENMLRVVEGTGQNLYPFAQLYRRSKKGAIPPSSASIVKFISEHAERLGYSDIAQHIIEMFDDTIRHAFAHSDYILHQDEFRSRQRSMQAVGEGFDLKTRERVPVQVTQRAIKIQDLIARLNRGFSFYQAVRAAHISHVRSYKEPKTIMTRMGKTRLLVHPEHGVHGFQSHIENEEATIQS